MLVRSVPDNSFQPLRKESTQVDHHEPQRWRYAAGLFTTMLFFFCIAAPVNADFMDGWRAYQKGEYSAALKHWTELAEKGDPLAQYNVGVMYDEGTGVPADIAKVESWWRKAAKQGHVGAQHNLALLLIERGKGPDFRNAATWLKSAAATGFVVSQYSLAKLYATGLGVEKDDARAFELFLMAGKAGFVKAQYNLGKIYRDGLGVEANPAISVDWFNKAAMRGYAKAQEKLVTRFATGIGVKEDRVEALKWAILAIQQGRTSVQKNFNDLRKTMNRDQISEAENRARAFRPIAAIQ